MTIINVSRAATTDEISAEMDRRGAVIEQLETALRQRADEATRAENEECAQIAIEHDCNGLIGRIDRHRGSRIAAAIRARITPKGQP